MRDLLKEEREFMLDLLKLKPQKRHGYFSFTKGNKHFRRSRILMQLHLDKRLDIWEIVHHKDGNRENDNIENLEVKDTSEHTSLHHAGKRKNTTIQLQQ